MPTCEHRIMYDLILGFERTQSTVRRDISAKRL